VTHALINIDIQNDYFEGGEYPLVGAKEAAERAADVLGKFRAAGLPVVHVQHLWDGPDAAFFATGSPGAEIHELVAPADGEAVVTKAAPNSFLDTDLSSVLAGLGVDHLVVQGMQTNLCIDASVRAGADLGWTITVVGDACAAPDLEHAGRSVQAADVHTAFLAALDGNYAHVVDSADLGIG
jgi:nicotinamidase-related amidase